MHVRLCDPAEGLNVQKLTCAHEKITNKEQSFPAYLCKNYLCKREMKTGVLRNEDLSGTKDKDTRRQKWTDNTPAA